MPGLTSGVSQTSYVSVCSAENLDVLLLFVAVNHLHKNAESLNCRNNYKVCKLIYLHTCVHRFHCV